MLNKNIETIIGCDKSFDEAGIVVFGAPFDSTTSYRPGARFAPKAIRNESYGIETYSPYQDKDLTDISVFDGGDLELCIGDVKTALKQIEDYTDIIVKAGKIPVMLGGEHLVSLGAMRSIVKKFPDVHIIHLDAHADLRDDYLGAELSHACVLRRIWEITGDGRIFQFGIRSGDRSEFIWGKDHVYTKKFNLDGFTDIIKQLKDKPVYFTLDLDVLDPSLFPGTGTPEAGGVSFTDLLDAIIKLSELNIVGADIVELSPPYDQSGVSTAAACKILREILCAIGGKIY